MADIILIDLMKNQPSEYIETITYTVTTRVVNGITVYERPESIKGRGHWEGSTYVKGSGAVGRWSKWGGVTQIYQEAIGDEWFCQSCSMKIPKIMTPYRYEHEGEYLRVCSACYASNCEVLKKRARLQSEDE